MGERITRADLAVQAAIIAAYGTAAGVTAPGDSVGVDKGLGGYALMVTRAGESGRGGHPFTDSGYGSIGSTAREAHATLVAMVKTSRAILTALDVDYVWPAAAIAAIRGESA
ncbi:hypothetical protein [Microbacterium lacus]|uniref:hypothetical protein n=1 Tax=Microbacterium lacus TaxID=415217 RepID=UPI0012FE517F|nr:hypothetical protein [Microbacterium lacus]